MSYEILIVDDGSKDSTSQVACEYGRGIFEEDQLKVLKLGKNRGKGGAVTQVRN